MLGISLANGHPSTGNPWSLALAIIGAVASLRERDCSCSIQLFPTAHLKFGREYIYIYIQYNIVLYIYFTVIYIYIQFMKIELLYMIPFATRLDHHLWVLPWFMVNMIKLENIRPYEVIKLGRWAPVVSDSNDK